MLNYQRVTHPKKSRRIPSPLRFAGASKDYENLGTGSVNREMQRAESCLGEARTWDGWSLLKSSGNVTWRLGPHI